MGLFRRPVLGLFLFQWSMGISLGQSAIKSPSVTKAVWVFCPELWTIGLHQNPQGMVKSTRLFFSSELWVDMPLL